MATFLIFLATYAVAALGRAPGLRLDRAGAALVGAVLMVLTGAIGFDEALRAVNLRTLVLLVGMMVLVAHLRLSGGVAALVRGVSRRLAHPLALLIALVFVSGGLSAFFVNDVVCFVLTPIAVDVAEARRHHPMPYLVALATAANIGSVATMTGSVHNMVIGTVSGLPFRSFAAALGPVALAGLALDAAVVWLVFGSLMKTVAEPDDLPPADAPVHSPVLFKTAIVALGMLAGFLAGYDVALVSAGGAAALLVTRRVSPGKVYAAIDFDRLMFVAGLFVVVGAAGQAGIDRRLFQALAPLGLQTAAGLAAAAAFLGTAVGSLPAVMLFTPMVPELPDPGRAWLAVAMASTLAGNLTLLGSTATMVVVDGANRRGVKIEFWEFAKAGVPVTFLTLAFGIWWLS